MPYLLHQIQHKSNWDRDPAAPRYLPEGEAPADVVEDLRTEENNLSVWHIEDNRSNLDRVIAALAAGRDFLQKFDFLLIDSQFLGEHGFKLHQIDGNSRDRHAAQNWHLHIVQISALGLGKLAELLFQSGEVVRKYEKQLEQLLRSAVDQGSLTLDDLKPKVREKVERAKSV